jgi:alkylated DNA repair dioxygenase AlkB
MLIESIAAANLAPFRFRGWLGNRKTQTFGWRYDFDDSSFTPAEPIPEWLHPLRARAASLAAIAPDEFVHVLVARYDPGAGIGWHRDRPQFEQVVGISLGSAATMRFRQRSAGEFRRANVDLQPRSAYLLSGEVRHGWEHSIAPGTRLRFSITFRSLSEKGSRAAARL